jgi:hypothetical protein
MFGMDTHDHDTDDGKHVKATAQRETGQPSGMAMDEGEGWCGMDGMLKGRSWHRVS